MTLSAVYRPYYALQEEQSDSPTVVIDNWVVRRILTLKSAYILAEYYSFHRCAVLENTKKKLNEFMNVNYIIMNIYFSVFI